MERNCDSLRLAKINLSAGSVFIEDVPELGERFFGGRGVDHYLLLQNLKRGVDFLHPENVITVGTGLLVGTGAPGANRCHIASTNALTGGLGSSSAGGAFAIELRRAGIDHLVITGQADIPVYLWIQDDICEIREANWLWGQDTRSTERLLREELGDENVQIACIGPAGENLARVSNVLLSGGRAFGRCGFGSILGAKKLKAIAVRGNGQILPCGTGFEKEGEEATRTVRGSQLLQSLKEHGTTLYATIEGDPYRTAPARNFQKGEPDRRFHVSEFDQFSVKHYSCAACPVGCSQELKVPSGKYPETYIEKIDGDTAEDFGFRLSFTDPVAILKAHERCQLLGLDLDNASGTIAWACECYERGILGKEDTDGLALKFGNEEVILELLEKIAKREGFGDLLADGSKIAAKRIEKGEEYSITIKGQELEESIRPYKGWALGVVVSERGGGHTRGCPLSEFASVGQDANERIWSEEVSERIFGTKNAGETTTYENKAIPVQYYERFHAVLDSIGMCYFMSNWMEPGLLSPKDVAVLVSQALDKDVSEDTLMDTGERIVALGKLFNQVHAGFERNDDYPPARLMNEAIEEGPYKGERLEKAEWDKMLDEYYKVHGWNVENGRISRHNLDLVGLSDLDSLLE